jgi:hypothetical protein
MNIENVFGRKHPERLFVVMPFEMSDVKLCRLSLLQADGRDNIEPQKREVCKVILVQRFVVEVSVDEPEAAQRPPPKG